MQEHYEHIEGGTPKQPENPDKQSEPIENEVVETVEDAFIYKPYEKVKSLPLALRIHLIIGISASVLCFFIWKWTSKVISEAPWWFIYPIFFFAMTLASHKYFLVDGKKYKESIFKGVYVLFGIANILLFFTNYLVSGGFPWFIFPLFVSVMICLVIYKRQVPTSFSFLKLMTYQYLLFNLLLFICWVALPRTFPWFFYPLLVLAYPLLTMYVKKVYKENRNSIFLIILSTDICLICFITWVFTDVWFPWFLLVWVILGAVNLFLWRSTSRGGTYFDIEEKVNNQESEKGNQTEGKTNLYPNLN